MPDFSQIRNELMTGILRTGQRVEPNQDIEYILKALAGAVYSQKLRIDYLTDQVLPSTADEKYLLIHGRNKRVPRSFGSKARGIALSFEGGELKPETRLISSTGNEYKVLQRYADKISYAVESLDVGADKNLKFEDLLQVVNPNSLIRELVVTINGITGGSDPETLEEYRERVVDAWRNPGEYGSTDNYYQWLRSRQELSKAFVFEATPFPGVVSWAALVKTQENEWDLANEVIIAEINSFLNTKRPPAARIQWLTEATLIRLDMVLTGVPAGSRDNLTAFIKNQLYLRAVVKGASGLGSGELTEGALRNIIAAFLQGLDFDVTVIQSEKLGVGRLNFGEIILAGDISYV